MLKVKDWDRFQHFKDRKPLWIKLYRDLLNDIQWHELSGDDAKTLVMLWLISSENDGELPSIKELAFRFRMQEKPIKTTISRLSHWLIQDDINLIHDNNLISEEYQDGIAAIPLARSLEKRREEKISDNGFDIFWKTYPKKKAKPAAEKAFRTQKINGELPDILKDIESRAQTPDWIKEGGQFVPYPATYLNNRLWEDENQQGQSSLGVFL